MTAIAFGQGRRVEIVLVYASLLGTYGDRGNAAVLVKRLAWRGYTPVLTAAEPGKPLPDRADIYLLGGGEDTAQTAAADNLRADGGINRAADRGAAIFAVCAGYQILGHRFTTSNNSQGTEGLGLLDITTTRAPRRAVGESLSRWIGRDGDDQWITGFENHGGHTTLGPQARPVAHIEAGVGNGDGTDGAHHDNIVGLYPHGPVLARNPALADHILEIALGVTLPTLHQPQVSQLRQQRIAAARQ